MLDRAVTRLLLLCIGVDESHMQQTVEIVDVGLNTHSACS